jgi:hypothetical protein
VTAIRRLLRSAFEQRRLFADYRCWMVERLGPVALESGRLLAGMGVHVSVRRPHLAVDGSTAGQWSFR